MATLIVRHKVADFENWKKVFDELTPTRRSHGWLGHDVLRDAADPNMVTIVNKVKTLEGAKAYGSSPGLQEAMKRAGVVSQPEIILTSDAEALSY